MTLLAAWIFLFTWTDFVNGYSYSDESGVRDAVFVNYSDSIRPVLDQNDTVNVHFKLELLNIESLEVQTQTLSTTVWVVVKWIDENLKWDEGASGGVKKFFVHDGDDQDVWKPDMSVSNTIDTFQSLGDGDVPISIHSDGNVVMEAGKVIKSHCEIDMTYYPFDSQSCEIIIGAWVYSTHEVNMTTENVNLDNYRENGEWEITSTHAERHDLVFDSVPQSVLWFTFNFVRRRPFFTMHIVLPMLFLSVLNIIVFVLPPDSGEKMSLAITNLLSFAVFLTLFSEQMPHSSRHTPIISMYLAATFIVSVLTVVVSTVVLRFHFHQGEVPGWMKKIYCGGLSRLLCTPVKTCPVCFPPGESSASDKKENRDVRDSQKNPSVAWSVHPEAERRLSHGKSNSRSTHADHQIDWQTVARITDWLAFILFLVATLLVGSVVIILLTTGS